MTGLCRFTKGQNQPANYPKDVGDLAAVVADNIYLLIVTNGVSSTVRFNCPQAA
jgi:hypothetical protein